jgi:RimJ/RimL family protein N-acetyltransferase
MGETATTAPPETLPAGPAELRRWRAEDTDALCEAVVGSLDHLLPWMAWARGYDRAMAAEFIAGSDRAWRAGSTYNYSIRVTGAVAGATGLMRDVDRPRLIAIGYWLRSEYVGHGYATAATAALVAAAFALPRVDAIEITHDAANHRSRAIPHRLGFTEVGRAQSIEPHTPARTGISVIWQLRRPA